jgi:transposase
MRPRASAARRTSLFFMTSTHSALLFATPGRDKATLGKFASDLRAHGGQPTAITHVSMDMSGSFQAGAAEHFPAAEVCFDRFHVVALSSTALDEVRRAEVKTANPN